MSTLLELDSISLRFGGVSAISDVSFSVNENELFAIIGPNGAGKTSIFNVISQVYRPQAGDIRWKGESLMGMRPDRVAALGIARTFQNIELFPQMTVIDNLLTGRHVRMKASFLADAIWWGPAKREEMENRRIVEDIIQLLDGELGVCIYTWATPDARDNYFYTSADDGRRWTRRAPVRLGNTNETAPVTLRSGRLLAAARTFCDQHLELLTSANQGKTWDQLGLVTLGCQHPAHLLQLRDDRVLLTYGIRNKGLYGLGARISRDDGKTWEPPRVLVDFQIAGDGGYPGSVQFEDGTILTAYYASATPGYQRYHMGVIRWSADQ